MGNRGNIVVRDEGGSIWFYTHWRGSDILDMAFKALSRKERWEDASYLARIVFDTLTDGEKGGTAGFGISLSKGNNEHEVVVIDTTARKVIVMPEDWEGRANDREEPLFEASFDDFIKVKVAAEANEYFSGSKPWPKLPPKAKSNG